MPGGRHRGRNIGRLFRNHSGARHLQEARDIIARADHAAVMARRMGSANARQLRVGIGYRTDQLNIAALLSAFHDHHQDIHVETRTMSVPAQSWLLDGQLDVGFVRPPVDDAALNSEIVISEPFVVVLPPTHHFASRPRLQLSALANEPFVLPPREAVPVFHDAVLIWLPYTLDGRMQRITPIARLADDVGVEVASSNVEAVLQQIRKTEPRVPGPASTRGVSRFEVRTIQENLVAPVRPLIVVLASAVAFVLLIACANVTNLLLNRNAARRQELVLRVALGASPGRVVRYVLTETLLLAALGGAAGLLLALGTVSALRTLGSSLARRDLTPGVSIPRLEEIQIDGTALIFTVATTLCVGLLVGLLPVARFALGRHLDALRIGLSGMASVPAGPSRGGRAALLVTQTALATMALVGGGLLVHSFVKLANVDPGYEAAHLLTFTVRSSAFAGSVPFSEDVAERLRGLA